LSKKRTKAARRSKDNPQKQNVAAVFDSYPKELKSKLLALRELILDTALTTRGVGKLEETLKWGQPSYLTTESGSGTTVRIDAVKSQPDRYAVYFHCQTNLVATFRELYPTRLKYEGNRGILFDLNDDVPEDAVRHCVSLALTYHQKKKQKRREL
jgi:hypothetical protein